MKRIIEWIEERPLIFLSGLIILNLIIRFSQISNSSIWQDEAYTITESLKSVNEIIYDSSVDQNPPLYFILIHFWVKLFGISELGVRSFSIFFNVLATIVLFLFARKHFNITTAIIATILFSFSELQIYFSLEARAYQLIAFLTVLSFFTFTSLMEKPSYKSAILTGILNALLIYAHFITCFIVAVQFSFGLFYWFTRGNKKVIPMVILSTIATILLFAPWIPNVLSNLPKEGIYWLQKPTFYNLKGLFIAFSNGKIMTVMVALLLSTSIVLLTKEYLKKKILERKHYDFILLLAWFMMPVILDYAVAFITPVFLIKYLLYSSIGMYLLVGFCLNELTLKESSKKIIMVGVIVLFIVSGKLKVEKTEDWKTAVSFIKTNASLEDITYLTDYFIYMPFSYYYNRKIFEEVKTTPEALIKHRVYPVSELTQEMVNSYLPFKKIFLVESHVLNQNSERTPLKVLEKNFSYVSKKEFGDIAVTIFEERK